MKIKIRRRKDEEVPASAMSDIAFLLIVFFMVIAVFAVKEGFIIKTPEKDRVVKKAAKDLLKVKLTPTGIQIAGEPVEKEKFKETLKEKRQGSRIVVFEIDKKTLYKEVVFVLDTFAELKILDFSMKEAEG